MSQIKIRSLPQTVNNESSGIENQLIDLSLEELNSIGGGWLPYHSLIIRGYTRRVTRSFARLAYPYIATWRRRFLRLR